MTTPKGEQKTQTAEERIAAALESIAATERRNNETLKQIATAIDTVNRMLFVVGLPTLEEAAQEKPNQ